jgi:hypothetical protein
VVVLADVGAGFAPQLRDPELVPAVQLRQVAGEDWLAKERERVPGHGCPP